MTVVGMVAFVLIIGGNSVLTYFGVGNAVRKTAAILQVEERGIINVSIEGGPLVRAEDELKLYAGDTVVSSPRNFATMLFFDGTIARLDESTHLTMTKSNEGDTQSVIGIRLEEGAVWVATPPLNTYSGSIIRTLESAYIKAEVPSKGEIVFSPRSITVYSADGIGLSVLVAGNSSPVIVGEGQTFTIPPGNENAPDLYIHRNPVSVAELQSPFVEGSRIRYAALSQPGSPATSGQEKRNDDTTLTVGTPKEGDTIATSTVEVSGRFGGAIDKVRINGYLATVNKEAGTYTQEIALPEEDDIGIAIEAVDVNGVVVAEALRTVKRNRKPPNAPAITEPAANGETYQTGREEIEISGTASSDTVGIVVNGYRLQLFTPGDKEWSYLASTKLQNFSQGKNVYEVTAINRGGYRSEPALLTILLQEGEEGILAEEKENLPESQDTPPLRTQPRSTEESQLPNNLPLMPKSISIYAPSRSTEFETSNTENVIEGNVPKETESVWVNGYRLRLYQAGKTFFNYIASVELGTLKRGRNVYSIVIRSKDGYIIDTLEYVIIFRP